MTPQLMTLLRTYTTVLPANESLNINTMPPLLWRVLNTSEQLEPLSEEDAAQLMQSSSEEGHFKDTAALIAAWDLTLATGVLDVTGLDVKTNYFELRTQVSLVNQQRVMLSLLHRTESDIRVERRRDGYL
jgi:type II secretory pathway component PulK